MLNRLDKERKQYEDAIMRDLLASVAEQQSLVFNAGAGAGKTYALVECLKYICKEKQEILNYHNQKTVCITYTNVAANEIKNRLGNTDLVLISTIHERLWDIIKPHQEQLVDIHCENMREKIRKMEEEVLKDSVLSAMESKQQCQLKNDLVKNRQQFYEIYGNHSTEFRENFKMLFPYFDNDIKNVDKFRKICVKLIQIEDYKKCLQAIGKKQEGFTEVLYDTRNNRDYLQYMKISHDTLLDYAYQIIARYKTLKRAIIDKYPYFFVDEFQDTHEIVVKILDEVYNYSKEINHKFFVGYFGDTVQSIYNKGIGENIGKYTKDFTYKEKKYNRRSAEEIIALGNRIRNDGMIQQSIYENASGGSVQIYYGTEKEIEKFVATNSAEMRNFQHGNNIVHCFLLLNKVVAEYNGFTQLYQWFEQTPYYKKHFDAISTELLNSDVNKLGEIERNLYNLIKFYMSVQNENTSLLDILPKEFLVSLDIESVCDIVDNLKKMTAITLGELIQAVEEFERCIQNKLVGRKTQQAVGQCIDTIIGMDHFGKDNLIQKISERLFQGDAVDEEKLKIFWGLDMSLLCQWCRYIDRDYIDDVVYHTFHSTKGLEYDNVVIVFGDSFGSGRNIFERYFAEYDVELDGHQHKSEAYIQARNLLYVAVTRARINLRILYTGDYQKNKDALNRIFGNISRWEMEI